MTPLAVRASKAENEKEADMPEITQVYQLPKGALDALLEEIRELRRTVEGATIVPPPKWLPIGEAAKRLGVDPSTIHRRIKAGEIEAKGAGRARRVKVEVG